MLLFSVSSLVANYSFGDSKTLSIAAYAQTNSSDEMLRIDARMPATVIVGRNFTLTGTIIPSINSQLDDIILTIEGSKQLLIFGDRTTSLGTAYSSNDQKTFSFTALVLGAGSIDITLSATGIRKSNEAITKDVTISSVAIEPNTTLAVENVKLEGDAAARSLDVTVSIINNGNFDAKDVIASLNVQGSVAIDESIKNIGSIPVNSNVTIKWSLQSVQGGIAQISVLASNAPTNNVNVPITFLQPDAQTSSKLSFSISSLPANIVRGTSFQIPFQLINSASSVAKDVFVSLEVPEGLSAVDNSTKYVGALQPSSNISSSFTLKATQTGSFSIKLTAYSSNNPSKSLPLTISVTDPQIKLALTSVSTNPLYLYPGDKRDRINVDVRNYGDEDMQGLTAKLALPGQISPSWSGSDMFTISVLQSSKDFPYLMTASQTMTFYLDIDRNARPGSYPVSVGMSDGVRNSSGTFTLIVMPKSSFLVSSLSYSRNTMFGSEDLNYVSPGGDNVIRISFVNNGTSAADSVVAQLQASNDFIGQGKTALATGIVDSVGTILPGQTFHSTYQLTIEDTIPVGTYTATVLLNWKQSGLSGDFSQTIPVKIIVGPKPIGDQIPYAQIFLGSISAIFVGLYVKSRKKRKEQDNEEKNDSNSINQDDSKNSK